MIQSFIIVFQVWKFFIKRWSVWISLPLLNSLTRCMGYGSSRKLVSMYRTLLEYFLFVWIFSCFVGEGKDENRGDGASSFLSLWQNSDSLDELTREKFLPWEGFVSVIYFSINQATMGIDLINQTMQIDAGNVGVNVWMFRVLSGVRIWHVGDAGNWKNTLSHLPRKVWQVEILLKLVKIR